MHGHTFPDYLTIYVGGRQVADANVMVSDATGIDPSSLTSTPDLTPHATLVNRLPGGWQQIIDFNLKFVPAAGSN